MENTMHISFKEACATGFKKWSDTRKLNPAAGPTEKIQPTIAIAPVDRMLPDRPWCVPGVGSAF
jgi:hypothetical protein